jgi:hypothetical protein
MELIYKPNWEETKVRLDNFWDQGATDRPCIAVMAPMHTEIPHPGTPDSPESYWLDPDYVCELMLHYVSSVYWGGESIPTLSVHPLMSGWFLGCSEHAVYELGTIWLNEFMESVNDHSAYNPGPADPLHTRIEELTNRMLDAAEGKCLVGYPFPMNINDLLPMAIGAEKLLMELVDNPNGCRRAAIEMWKKWDAESTYFQKLVDARQEGHFWGWPGLWSSKTATLTQSDMSCNLGPVDYERFVCAELDLLGEKYERVWYHLDGPGAIRHLPALLTKPYLKVIQWVPGAGQPPNGPCWIDLYKQVQAAGRGLDLDVPFEHMEYLLRNLKPEGIVLRTSVETPEKAEELLETSVKISGSDI